MELDEIKDEIKRILIKIDDIKDYELDEDEYDELIDEVYEDIDILGASYSPAYVLKEIDEIRYNLGLGEEEQFRKDEMIDELKSDIGDIKGDLEELKEKIKNKDIELYNQINYILKVYKDEVYLY